MLSTNSHTSVDHKLELMEKILLSDNFYREFDLSSLYLFVNILVHEKFIFYNFFEKVFVEAYSAWQADNSKRFAEILKRITFLIAKICELMSYYTRKCSIGWHSDEPVLRNFNQYHQDLLYR